MVSTQSSDANQDLLNREDVERTRLMSFPSQTPTQAPLEASPDTLMPNANYDSVFDDLSPFLNTSSMPLMYCPINFDLQLPLNERLSTPRLTAFDQMQCQDLTAETANVADVHIGGLDLPCQVGSQLPSLLSDPPIKAPQQQGDEQTHALHIVTEADRQRLTEAIEGFQSAIPFAFNLPSRHGLSRYLAAYAAQFHPNMPFLNVSTMTIDKVAPELILAMAAAGSQICFEASTARNLFNVAKSIAVEQLHRREQSYHARSLIRQESSAPWTDVTLPTITEPSAETTQIQPSLLPIARERVLHTAQAVLLLMAIATWGDPRTMFREVFALQGILVTILRQERLLTQHMPPNLSWEEWIYFESAKRTTCLAYGLFNYHSIIYNIPPALLTSELDMNLPCRETEWPSPKSSRWEGARNNFDSEPSLQAAFRALFSRSTKPSRGYSSLGSYVLIHALIQHIFFLRQAKVYQLDSERTLSESDVLEVEKALDAWREQWERSPESSLDPLNPRGPVSFNSTALLRVAYIRLAADMGSWRALKTPDPRKIAEAIFQSPPIPRSRTVTRAALHSAHALSIPIKLGVDLVIKNQVFTWSVQHSVGSLECACLLSKWLDTVTTEPLEPSLAEDELRLVSFVANMLEEVSSSETFATRGYRSLSADVVRVWSNLFRGERVWDAVGWTYQALSAYEGMLG